MKRPTGIPTTVAAGVLLLLPAMLFAQSTFGTILGTATDDSGAVVPQAKVIITSQEENVSRVVATDGQGNFEALNLNAGTYTVAAEARGFRAFRAAGLQLMARQTLRVNVVFKVGEVSETLDVTAAASVVATDTAAIGSTLGTRQVLDLPINYRGSGSTSPLRVLAYQPGVQSDNGFGYAVQGALPAQTEVSLDGISTVSAASNGPLAHLFPSADGIAEMKVQAVGSNAEFAQVGDITTTGRAGNFEVRGIFHQR